MENEILAIVNLDRSIVLGVGEIPSDVFYCLFEAYADDSEMTEFGEAFNVF